MMMPTLRIAFLCGYTAKLARAGLIRDAAENFVEASRLQVQLVELEALRGGELGDRRENVRTCAGERRDSPFALAHFDFRHRRDSLQRSTQGRKLARVIELHGHGVVVARFDGEFGR